MFEILEASNRALRRLEGLTVKYEGLAPIAWDVVVTRRA